MLEEILNKINGNLERIANALEENNKLIKEPIKFSESEILDAVTCIEKLNKKAEVKEQATQVQNQNTVVPVAPVVQPIPVTPTEPVNTAPVVPTIPTTIVQESFTQEQLARAMSNAVSVGKMNVIQGILNQLGVQALTQINPTDYNKLAVMLKEAGVEI